MHQSPILNSPYKEPTRHLASDDKGLTDKILDFRRPSSFFIPVPRAKTRQGRLDLTTAEGALGSEMQKENVFINKVRTIIGTWRVAGYPGITKTSRDLLTYWQDDTRENRLFFCQIEALETLIYATEVAERAGEQWIVNDLKKANTEANPGLNRLALKMATGSGKTVVMAMIIAWQTLNKIRSPHDARFVDAFVVITPGITIRDRLNVLLPNDPHNYYRVRDLVPHHDMGQLQQAIIHIVNYHQIEQRTVARMRVGGVLSSTGLIDEAARKESPSAMVARAFKPVIHKSRVLVLNDEAHHCYRGRPTEEKMTREDKREAEENNKAARVWIRGIEALAKKITVNAVVDLSATPYFLRGSGYDEGALFPWTISDFSLLDALEAGIVKIPRLPVASDRIAPDGEPLEFRNLWHYVRDDLPKQGQKTGKYDMTVAPVLPTSLETALLGLYGNYEAYDRAYRTAKEKNPAIMPPVMIIVCNNTAVSNLVYRWIAGFERETATGNIEVKEGHLALFRNEDGFGMLDHPPTLLIDSQQIESGEKIDDEFKKIYAREITEFHREYKNRFPGREDPTDEALLREIMNTVGKPGTLGERIRCVVSVSMLTEGWDVNTVTHILGVRAFSTSLLCEQVVGRALRRADYSVGADGLFSPEYAEVYGVPFSFLKASGATPPQPPREIHRVHALDERAGFEITFPRVEGYRYDLDETRLAARFTKESNTIIENETTATTRAGVLGAEATETSEQLRQRRETEVVLILTHELLNRHYCDADGTRKYWLLPQLKPIVEEYVRNHVVRKDRMMIGLLTVGEYLAGAVTKIQHAITAENRARTKARVILPIMATWDPIGSTRFVDFITTKAVQETTRSHVNYVVADTVAWEQGVAQALEQMRTDEVIAYVKNQELGFTIPYEHQGVGRGYYPDFLARVRMPDASITTLIIEVTGKKDDKKAMKVKTAREFWVPAVNNAGKYGRWAFLEIQDIHETQNLIRYGIAHGFDSFVKPAML